MDKETAWDLVRHNMDDWHNKLVEELWRLDEDQSYTALTVHTIMSAVTHPLWLEWSITELFCEDFGDNLDDTSQVTPLDMAVRAYTLLVVFGLGHRPKGLMDVLQDQLESIWSQCSFR